METQTSTALSDIEIQTMRISQARAVLDEAVHYMEKTFEPDSFEAKYFIIASLPRIRTLLDVTDHILYEAEPALDQAIESLYAEKREEN